MPPFPVLYEDNHLLVISKPAMLPTMGVAADRPSLLTMAKQYIKEKYDKPGKVYLGIVSRLDAPVTGIVLIARTSKAAARLTDQFKTRTVRKLYWALVEGSVLPTSGAWVDYMRKDERHRRMNIAQPNQSGAQEARLSYRVRGEVRGHQLVEIELETGRKHQIRVQFACRDHPVLGDRKYGGQATGFKVGIALHARSLSFAHPIRQETIELHAPLPAVWQDFGVEDEYGE
tara:strand:- start:38 stop:727 length:690 start_codon:yes stop_codon:yes gene_type:complete